MLKNVDLPAPLGPMRARISPRGRTKLMPSTARTPPKAFSTPCTRSTGSPSGTSSRPHHAENAARERHHEDDQDGAEDELPVLRVLRHEGVEHLEHGGT